MKAVGIVVEYNPFHNGHLYQIKKIKEKYKDFAIVVVTSSSFTQRGSISVLNKIEKTNVALEYKVDLVIELPFPFSTQSADTFAYGSIKILNELKIDTLVFGSESNDLNKLTKIAKTQINNKEFDKLVKNYIKSGINYPTALNKAIKKLTNLEVSEANDLLGISYIKEIIKNNYNIKIDIIKRTNDFHDLNSNAKIVSASNIREKMKNNIKIKKYVPALSYKYLKNKRINDNYFKYLKYQIINNIDDLNKFKTVDEGIENRIKKYIFISNNLDEFIKNIKTKRYTYNKINRMLTHILVGFTKEKSDLLNDIKYIRVLGFNDIGKSYLKSIKKSVTLPIITNYVKNNDLLDFEYKVTNIYNLVMDDNLIEYKIKPIKK